MTAKYPAAGHTGEDGLDRERVHVEIEARVLKRVRLAGHLLDVAERHP